MLNGESQLLIAARSTIFLIFAVFLISDVILTGCPEREGILSENPVYFHKIFPFFSFHLLTFPENVV